MEGNYCKHLLLICTYLLAGFIKSDPQGSGCPEVGFEEVILEAVLHARVANSQIPASLEMIAAAMAGVTIIGSGTTVPTPLPDPA